MNNSSCYRKNLPRPPLTDHRVGSLWGNAWSAILLGICCTLACLFLASCGKSAAQYIDRGNQLYASGQYSDATINYRNALKKSPNSGEAYYRLGLALLKQNQVGEAYQAFNHAASLDPKNMRAKIQLANLSLTIYA